MPDRPPGARRVESVMGMPVGIDVRDHAVRPGALDEAFAVLRRADRLFSTYRPDSQISRLESGSLSLSDSDRDVVEVLAACERLRVSTEGCFDVRAGGRLDPSGLVKGWAVDRAHDALVAAGVRHGCINAAGDVRVWGGREDGSPWRVGIRDPRDATRVAAVLEVADGAIATSGAYERGDHVLDPRTGRPARGLLSATVTGPVLATADALATALFAHGAAEATWLAAHPGYRAMAVAEAQRRRSLRISST